MLIGKEISKYYVNPPSTFKTKTKRGYKQTKEKKNKPSFCSGSCNKCHLWNTLQKPASDHRGLYCITPTHHTLANSITITMLGTAQVSALQATPPFGRLTDNNVSELPFNNLSPALTPNFVRIISSCQAQPNLQSCWTTLSSSSRTPLAGLVDTWTILSILGYASVSDGLR